MSSVGWCPLRGLFLGLALFGCSTRDAAERCGGVVCAPGLECRDERCMPACGPLGCDRDAGPSPGECTVRCGPLAVCCGESMICEFDACVPECAGVRCAGDRLCCAAGELCVGNACVEPGAPCTSDADCPLAHACEPLVGRCVPVPADAQCRYRPPPGVFEPALQWERTGYSGITTPLVLELTDDNGDLAIDARDVPDVVAIAIAAPAGFRRVIAFSGDDGRTLWESELAASVPAPAAGDLDGDGTVEIVAAGTSGTIILSHTGVLERTIEGFPAGRPFGYAIADLEGDGSPEIIAGGAIYTRDGRLRWMHADLGGLPSVADLDLDGRLDVAGPTVAYKADGSTLWRAEGRERGYTAIARIVDTPSSAGPQVVAVDADTLRVLDGATGATLLGPVRFETSGAEGAGPPTIADFDRDGRPEIGVAGETAYVVFDAELPAPHIRWSVPSRDESTGSAGSTVFDFDADGSAEVVFADECHLRILSGMDGTLLWYASHLSATTLEYPVVADVDADGNAEIVVVSNTPAFDPRCERRSLPWAAQAPGVRVYRDRLDNWVATRTIWNQHTYHLDNVRDDGSIPNFEPRGWMSHNTFRLNALLDPEAATRAADLVVVSHSARVDECPEQAKLRARIENRGSRGVASGVRVAFFAGEAPDRSTLLGVGTTSNVLLAGSGEWVEIVRTDVPLDPDRMLRFYAVVDDDGGASSDVSECQESNNVGRSITVDCSGPD
jgi:hypothetical protein